MPLNTASSIVDYLKGKGLKPQVGEQFPLFKTRKQLYEQSDLGSQLGDFRGTEQQNTQLLRRLVEAEKRTGVPISQDNIFNVLKVGQRQAAPTLPVNQQVAPQPSRMEQFTQEFQATHPGETVPFTGPGYTPTGERVQQIQPQQEQEKFQQFKPIEGDTQAIHELPQDTLDWYRLPKGTEFFGTSGPSGGFAHNLAEAPEGTLFYLPQLKQQGYEGYPDYFVWKNGNLVPVQADAASQFGKPKTIYGDVKSVAQQVGVTPLTMGIGGGKTQEQAQAEYEASLGVKGAPSPQELAETGQLPAGGGLPSSLRDLAVQAQGRQLPENIGEEAMRRLQAGATFPLEQARFQQEKAQLEQEAKGRKEQFINEIASRGLFFSGKRAKGEAAIDAQKIAQAFNIDNAQALLIAKGLENATQQIVKEAQQGSREAQDALEKLGYGLNPLTGRIEPTLQARQLASQEQRAAQTEERQAQAQALAEERQTLAEQKAETQQQQFAAQQERLEKQAGAQQKIQQAQLELSEARLAVSMAQNKAQMEIANRRLEIAEKNANKVGSGVSDLNRQLKELQIQQAEQALTTGTQAQGLTAGYAERIQQSNQIFNQLENSINKYSAAGYAVQRKLPNWAPRKDPNIQSQEQAERNFINSVLRRESGAVISPQEFDNAKKQYFVQPGDGKKVIAQKKANRQLVEKSFIKSSGRAFTPVISEKANTFNDIWK